MKSLFLRGARRVDIGGWVRARGRAALATLQDRFLHEGLDSLKSSTREGVCRVSQNPKHAKTLDCVRKNGAGGSEARSIDGSLAVMRSLEKRLQSWASGEPRSCRALDVEA